MEFLTKPSQDLLKTLISVLIHIHRQILFSKKNKMETFPCFVQRVPVLNFFHDVPNCAGLGRNAIGAVYSTLGITLKLDIVFLKN